MEVLIIYGVCGLVGATLVSAVCFTGDGEGPTLRMLFYGFLLWPLLVPVTIGAILASLLERGRR